MNDQGNSSANIFTRPLQPYNPAAAGRYMPAVSQGPSAEPNILGGASGLFEFQPQLQGHNLQGIQTFQPEYSRSTKDSTETKMVAIANPFSLTPKIFPNRLNRLVKTEENHYKTRAASTSINPAKALDTLRSVLQPNINKDILHVLQKYKQTIELGIKNIQDNYGNNVLTENQIQGIYQDALENAKCLFATSNDKQDTYIKQEEETEKKHEVHHVKRKKHKPSFGVDGDKSYSYVHPKTSKSQDLVRREGPKWDPERLTENTEFVMGARANKALGLGATRGRLYYKHPDLFKYASNQEERQWLYENNLMPAAGGKAFILIAEDIFELARNDEYRNDPGLMLDCIQTFKVPSFILDKLKSHMKSLRTDNK